MVISLLQTEKPCGLEVKGPPQADVSECLEPEWWLFDCGLAGRDGSLWVGLEPATFCLSPSSLLPDHQDVNETRTGPHAMDTASQPPPSSSTADLARESKEAVP